MKRKYVEYFIIIIILLFTLLYNRFFINNNLDIKSISEIYCNNIYDDYNDYKSYMNNNEYILSKVKYRNIYNLNNEFTIYRGFNDNLTSGLAVMDNNGLIGIISKCYANESIVRLITNKNSLISVRINDNYGILKYDNNLFIDDITGNVSIGDITYTSGFGYIMKDIPVGTVKDIIFNNLSNKIIIEPFVNFNKVNYLYVIGDTNG